MSSSEPAKTFLEIKDIPNDSSQRTTSISLPNNDKVKFTLTCNPNVVWNEGKYTMIYLRLESPIQEEISIQYRFSIVNQSGENVKIQEGQETFLTKKISHKHGVAYPIERSFLLDSTNRLLRCEYVKSKSLDSGVPYIQNLKICCEIKEFEYEDKYDSPEDDSFIQNFQTLLETGKYADAALFVGDKELQVHKNILIARSKVFSAMFEHDCEEKKQNRVEITDIQLDVCEELLRYIYTGKIESMSKLAVELLVASDKYELDELKNECEAYLKENLSVETVVDVLLLADLHQAKQLRAACIDFISENGKKIQNTSGWTALVTKANLTKDLFLKVTDKYEQLKNPLQKKKMNYGNRLGDYMDLSQLKLKKDFGTLIENEKFSDVVFNLQDGELRVHKNILSVRSKVFANIFEQEQNRIEMTGVRVEVCKQLLLYIYSDVEYKYGNYLLDKKYADELLILSEKYELSDLKNRSEQKISEALNIDTVSSKLLLADKYNAAYLKEKCIEYITANCRQVTQTEEWKNLTKSKPELLVDLYERIAAKQWY